MSSGTFRTKIGRRAFSWSPAVTLYVVLFVLLAVVALGSLNSNPFGPYIAAYVSTALVAYGIIDAVSKLRARVSLGRTIPVLVVGIITAAYMNMTTLLGQSVYISFLFGQFLTVGLVMWLRSADEKARARQ